MKSKKRSEEEKCFIELYHSCKDAMYRKAYRVVQNHADAQDAVQNALARLWEVRDKLPEEPAKYCSYAVIAAHNAAIDLYQKNKRHLKLYSSMTEDIITLGQRCGVNPFHYIAAMEHTEEILLCLKKINEGYCEIIMLIYYRSLSIKEAAKMLGISEEAARTKLCRAKKALEKELERLGYGNGKEEKQEKEAISK